MLRSLPRPRMEQVRRFVWDCRSRGTSLPKSLRRCPRCWDLQSSIKAHFPFADTLKAVDLLAWGILCTTRSEVYRPILYDTLLHTVLYSFAETGVARMSGCVCYHGRENRKPWSTYSVKCATQICRAPV